MSALWQRIKADRRMTPLGLALLLLLLVAVWFA